MGGMERERDIERTAALLGVEVDDLRGGLNLTEAAGLLGIAPSTLRQRALAGRISHQRDARRWIFGWRDLADYIASRQRGATGVSARQHGGTADPRVQAPARDNEARGESDVMAEAREFGLLPPANRGPP